MRAAAEVALGARAHDAALVAFEDHRLGIFGEARRQRDVFDRRQKLRGVAAGALTQAAAERSRWRWQRSLNTASLRRPSVSTAFALTGKQWSVAARLFLKCSVAGLTMCQWALTAGAGDGPMMISRITTFAFEGVEARPIDVQVQLSGGVQRLQHCRPAGQGGGRKPRACARRVSPRSACRCRRSARW